MCNMVCCLPHPHHFLTQSLNNGSGVKKTQRTVYIQHGRRSSATEAEREHQMMNWNRLFVHFRTVGVGRGPSLLDYCSQACDYLQCGYLYHSFVSYTTHNGELCVYGKMPFYKNIINEPL